MSSLFADRAHALHFDIRVVVVIVVVVHVVNVYILFFFFFKQKTAYELRISDWSSDVCSSDLLDKDSIRDIAYGGAGSTQWSPIPESSWAYAEQEGYEYNLDAAAALLAEAGASDLSFTLEIPSGFPDAEQIARVWQASLAEIGVTLTPRSEEHTSEFQSLMRISYAVFCLKKNKKT